MSPIVVPEDATAPRRADHEPCRWCQATAAGCRSNEWLRGRRCCDACDGDHDEAGEQAIR